MIRFTLTVSDLRVSAPGSAETVSQVKHPVDAEAEIAGRTELPGVSSRHTTQGIRTKNLL